MSGTRFVRETGTKQDDEDTRKTIRRHVMLGKNQGRTHTPKQPTIPGAAFFGKDDWKSSNQPIQSVVPGRVGTDLSFLEFAEFVELPLMNDTLRFCVATNKLLFVLEPCISFDSTHTNDPCIEALAHDALHLNVMVFSAQVYMAGFRQTTSEEQGSSRKASLQHYGKALRILRERVADAEGQRSEISEMTVMSVLPLAIHALLTGEHESMRNHVSGLKRLVSMRDSGVYSFRARRKQMIDILRCDLSISLATGQAPVFFSESSHEPMFSLPELAILHKPPERCISITNSELAKIWDVLMRFCAMVNEVAVNQRRFSEQVLLETMASVMYRLLNMSVTPDSAANVIRLSMLSFCASIFLPWQQLRIPFGWLQLEHKRSLAWLMQSNLAHLDRRTILWVLTIYGMNFSPLPADEHEQVHSWLTEVADLYGLTNWDGAKNIVGDFLWIDIVCDQPARKLFDEILTVRVAAQEL